MFTIDELISEVCRLAAERPDFVYERPVEGSECQYIHEGDEPGCIFGHALLNLGVDPDKLRRSVAIHTVLQRLGVDATADQLDWCLVAQSAQDTGEPWAVAVRNANQNFPLAVFEWSLHEDIC